MFAPSRDSVVASSDARGVDWPSGMQQDVLVDLAVQLFWEPEVLLVCPPKLPLVLLLVLSALSLKNEHLFAQMCH